MSKIMNIEDVQYQPWEHGERFQARLGAVGAMVGAKKLGYNVTVVAPGKRAFPFHNHRVNEEMFFILEGKGQIRIGEDIHPVKAGDFICCPPGGRDMAHQLINTSQSEELKFLAVSTRQSPEIAEYPDSDKVGVLGEFPGGESGKPEVMRFIIRDQADMEDYWAGE